jgi:single-strand DNA-binding protein
MMNYVLLSGRLASDPEIRLINDSTSYTRFVLAIRRARARDSVDYIDIRAWGILGEVCARYLRKGSWVAVAGSLRRDLFTRADGTKDSATFVVARNVEFAPKNGTRPENEDENPAIEASSAAEPGMDSLPKTNTTPNSNTNTPPDVPDPLADEEYIEDVADLWNDIMDPVA